MRLKLAAAPGRTPDVEPVRGREAFDSWRNWVAIKAPREKPPEPEETIRLLNNLKPYVPRWEP